MSEMKISVSSNPRSIVKPYDLELKSDPSALVQKAAARRDIGTCTSCGFTSARYMRVVPARENAIAPSDYRTVCPYCWQVSHLDVAARQRSAELVWMPELSQREINREMPQLYAERLRVKTPLKSSIKQLLDLADARRAAASEKLGGKKTDKLKDLFRETPVGTPAFMDQLEEGFRVWPLDRMILKAGQMEYNQFPQMLAFWRSRSGPLSGDAPRLAITVQDWLKRLSA